MTAMLRSILRFQARPQAADSPEPAQGAAVLVLAAERPARSTVSLLTAEGYAAQSSTSISEACALLRAEPAFEAVVLECANAAATAVTSCNQLKEAAPNVPVLVLVDVADVSERVLILDAGATVVLEGGYATAELLARLRALVRRRRGETNSGAASGAAEAPSVPGPPTERQSQGEPPARTTPPLRVVTVTLLGALLVLAADLATKSLVETSLPAAQRLRPLPLLSLVHAHGGQVHAVSALALLVGLLVLAMSRRGRPAPPGSERRAELLALVALATLFAAATGNLAQLAVSGKVTDFIALSHAPALNVADLLGLAALLAMLGASAAKLAGRHPRG